MLRGLATLAIAAVVLAGCSAPSATEGEVAQVIAQYEPGWRAVIDDISDCRSEFFSGKQVVECWKIENDAVDEMGAAADDLEDLIPPEGMADLVADAIGALRRAADLKASECGEAGLPDLESETCVNELGSRATVLRDVIGPLLDRWSPYL